MKIDYVELQGFRSFRDIQSFDFGDVVGVVNLTGRNDDEPTLGANGAGKSSLWEAVMWCLYGSTSAGLKGPETATWGQGRGIYVMCRIRGQQVTRTWGPNSLRIEKEDATQEQVDELIGLAREQFLFCTYLAQHTDAFLDLGAMAKTELLASILSLDKWLDYSALATRGVAECDGILRDIGGSTTAARSKLETIEGTDYATLHKKWQGEKIARVRLLREELGVLVSWADRAQEEDVTAGALRRTTGEAWAQMLKQVEVSVQAHKVQQEQYKELRDRCEHLRASAKGGLCALCGQKLPVDRGAKESLRVAEDRLGRLQAALDQAQAEMREAGSVAFKREEAHRHAADVVLTLATRMRETKSRIEDKVKALDEARLSRSPYELLIVEKAERIEALQEQLRQLDSERAQEEARRARMVHWVQGFKDVRLFLVAEALLQLEVEVNSALESLGLVGWSIHFAPDSETKAGATKRGFSVTVLSPVNERPVPWQVWSGGEAQRLRLAASMGLSNLISAYTAFEPFVEVWDEPTNGMSKEGIADLLTAMQERAQRYKRQVWVIDHRTLDAGLFQQTVTAVKAGGTTTLQRTDHEAGE